jgi:cysteinyl-tRNA synthetase
MMIFNTPRALARLFELVPIINSIKDQKISKNQISKKAWDSLKEKWFHLLFDVFGLKEDDAAASNGPVDGLMQLIIELRQQARVNKDWPTSDKIRDTLQELEIVIKDGKEETSWTFK